MNSRRLFLKQAGLLAAATSTGAPAVVRAAEVSRRSADAIPRHIIHLVADGTSSGTLTLGDCFSTLTRARGLKWLELARLPEVEQAFMNTRSLNSLVTDSAAAATAWGSGSRVMNGSLNLLPDGRKLRPLHVVFGDAGWKRGLVTTTEITHATPAGFAATAKREEADAIAAQYLAARIEVLLGGGKKFFDPAQRTDKRDLYADYRTAGYAVMTQADQLDQAHLDQPWLGTFSSSHLPYTLDHQHDQQLRKEVPTLAHMTRRALQKLGREDRFLLQIEGGRVDHAAHANDIAGAVHDVVAFDEAIEACLEFQRSEPDTLLIITTDHGTANPGLNGSGGTFGSKPPLFAHVAKARASFGEISRRAGSNPTAGKIQEVLAETTGYKAPDRKAAFLASFFAKKGLAMYEAMNSVTLQLGQLLANHNGVGWTGGEHTADYVPVLALGPGAARFRGFLENTDLFHQYLALARIDFRNPEVPLLAETGPSAASVEPPGSWV
jgi:alkaline phosphatase